MPSPVNPAACCALTEVTGNNLLLFISYTPSDAIVMKVVPIETARLSILRISSLSALVSVNSIVELGSLVNLTPPVRTTDSVLVPDTPVF